MGDKTALDFIETLSMTCIISSNEGQDAIVSWTCLSINRYTHIIPTIIKCPKYFVIVPKYKTQAVKVNIPSTFTKALSLDHVMTLKKLSTTIKYGYSLTNDLETVLGVEVNKGDDKIAS